MRRMILATFVVSLLIASAASAQMRGRGRLQGNVHDKATGQPIAGATVTISGNNTTPIVVKADNKGHWAAIGMTSGQWDVDISAPGYVTSRGTANVSEVSSAPPINIDLNPEPKAEPTVAPTPSVPQDAVDALKAGQDLLRAEGSADDVKANAVKAIAQFEKALPEIPDTTPQLHDVRNQVYGVLAQAYYKAGDVKNAIATLEKLATIDPGTDPVHAGRAVLLANLYLENGQLDQGRALLEKPENAAAITDPTAYLNIGILFLNKKDPASAITYFSKAIALDAKNGDGYYYRGLAEVQLKKNAEAKADLQQVVAIAPDSPAASDAKQLLASLK